MDRSSGRTDRRIAKATATDAGSAVARSVAADYGKRVEKLQGQASDDERRFYGRVSFVLADHYRRHSTGRDRPEG